MEQTDLLVDRFHLKPIIKQLLFLIIRNYYNTLFLVTIQRKETYYLEIYNLPSKRERIYFIFLLDFLFLYYFLFLLIYFHLLLYCNCFFFLMPNSSIVYYNCLSDRDYRRTLFIYLIITSDLYSVLFHVNY